MRGRDAGCATKERKEEVPLVSLARGLTKNPQKLKGGGAGRAEGWEGVDRLRAGRMEGVLRALARELAPPGHCQMGTRGDAGITPAKCAEDKRGRSTGGEDGRAWPGEEEDRAERITIVHVF